ncbi:MAG TPA: CBS domain-containing protein [Candidatus Saccharimonadales bacterium]|nr:CBS domain-containing protein [Candidatus Saccharimonadales bacterium]
MNDVIFALVLLLLSLGGVVVRKTYFHLPVRELKRRARRHDAAARSMYRAVAYDNSLRGLLWLFTGLTAAGGLILLARELNVWISLLIVAPSLWIAFSLVPASRVTRFGTWLTVLVTPPIAWLLNYLHPLLSRGAGIVEGHYAVPNHTKLYEREDLVRLIERQQEQEDSRFTQEELDIAARALSFDDYHVADVMTPRKKIKTILAKDTIGPVLINEVHESGQELALVRDTAKGPFVGSVRSSQLGIESKGHVRDVMSPTVYYVHEADSLGEALHAFFTTNEAVFVVVNSSEEYVGVITIEHILKMLLGHVPGDDFDQYADPQAVAARHPHIRKPTSDDPVKTDEEVVE